MAAEISGKAGRLPRLPARKLRASREVRLLAVLAAIAQEAKGPPPAPVLVATAECRMLAPVTWYLGTVISRNQGRVAVEVNCRLE